MNFNDIQYIMILYALTNDILKLTKVMFISYLLFIFGLRHNDMCSTGNPWINFLICFSPQLYTSWTVAAQQALSALMYLCNIFLLSDVYIGIVHSRLQESLFIQLQREAKAGDTSSDPSVMKST